MEFLRQAKGIISAGFAGESSWEWCFDGLPLNSTVAVTQSYSEMWHEREKRKLIGRRKPTGRIILKGDYGGASGRAGRLRDGYFYFEFLPERPPEKSPDLFVDDQIEDELARYPDDEPKPPGKVVFLSRHETFEIGFRAFCEGYKEAKRKGFIRGEVEFWFHGEIHTFEEEEE